MQYEDYIKRSILANNEFGICSVNSFEHLKSMSFIRAEYPRIANLANAKNVEAIKNLPPDSMKTLKYLIILKFTDQSGQEYIVTTYDSDELTQDPQVIDVFRL